MTLNGVSTALVVGLLVLLSGCERDSRSPAATHAPLDGRLSQA